MAQLQTKFIANSAITTAKIADAAVDQNKIVSTALGSGLTGGSGSAIAVDTTVVRTNGANAFTADQSLGGFKLTNVADPTLAQDAATKNYVDTAAGNAANKALSNLTSTSINQSLLPSADNAVDLGSLSKRWGQAYIATANVNNYNLRTTSGGVLQLSSSAFSTPSGATSLQMLANASVGFGQSLLDFAITTNSISSGVVHSGTLRFETGNNAAGDSGDVSLQSGTATGTRGKINLNGRLVDVNSTKIVNVADPTSAQDAATKNYVDTQDALRATVALDNLASTAVNVDLNPTADVTQNLGTSLKRWNKINTANVDAGSSVLTLNGSHIDVNSKNISNVADPVSSQDAATKAYVDAIAAGLSWKAPVVAATTADVDLTTGTLLTIDGYTVADGDRVLVWQQTDPKQNGIYIAHTGAWLRSADDSTTLEMDGLAVFVVNGTVNAGSGFTQVTPNPVIGTDNIVFNKFTSVSFIGGDMITLSGQVISVDLATVSGLESSNPGNAAGQLRVKLEASNPTLKITGSNELAAKLDGARAITTGASGIGVNVDGTSIDIAANAIEIKAAGVTLAKLASNSVDENKIVSTAVSTTGGLTGGSGTKLAANVDSVTTKINGSNQIETLKQFEQQITLGAGDITAQFVDLAHAVYGTSASVNSISLSVVGGLQQQKTVDYTVSLTGGTAGVTRVTFAGDLATGGNAALVAGDILVITYSYLT